MKHYTYEDVNMSERMSISVEVLNKALTVLTQLPYSQVAQAIQEIQQDVKPLPSMPEASQLPA